MSLPIGDVVPGGRVEDLMTSAVDFATAAPAPDTLLAVLMMLEAHSHVATGWYRNQLCEVVGRERLRGLERLARALHRELVGAPYASEFSMTDVVALADWIARHRPGGLLTSDEAAAQAAAAPASWMLRDVWSTGSYGSMVAPQGVGKTMAALDLSVAVAAGVPWLGTIPVDRDGTVCLFAGEGDIRDLVRRGQAIAAHYEQKWEDLPIYMSLSMPNLITEQGIEKLRACVTGYEPALLIIDPLYRAAPRLDTTRLFDVGAVLAAAQEACAEAGTSLLITHHTAAHGRASGAGVTEWSRVNMSLKRAPRSYRTDPMTGRTDVTLKLDIESNDTGQSVHYVRRSVEAGKDRSSPMRYRVGPSREPSSSRPASSGDVTNSRAAATGAGDADMASILQTLAASGSPMSERAIAIATNLPAKTVSRRLKVLCIDGLAEFTTSGRSKLHVLTDAGLARART